MPTISEFLRNSLLASTLILAPCTNHELSPEEQQCITDTRRAVDKIRDANPYNTDNVSKFVRFITSEGNDEYFLNLKEVLLEDLVMGHTENTGLKEEINIVDSKIRETEVPYDKLDDHGIEQIIIFLQSSGCISRI